MTTTFLYVILSIIEILILGEIITMSPDEEKVLKQSQKYSNWLSQKLYYSTAKSHQRTWTVKRGEVYFVDLGQNIGSEENKIRPVVVLQANSYNFRSPVFTCAIISSSPLTIPDIQVPIINTYTYTDEKKIMKQLVGTIDLGQIKTIAKERIITKKVCTLTTEMSDIDEKLLNVFGLSSLLTRKENTIKSLLGKIDYLKNQL